VPIRILADEVASQIAAGEVVERPASVVKELFENGLDAGASRIEIRVVNAGRSQIEVSDDGEGILYEELSLAITRHATSKLHTAEDLFQINSLGFRGEALASIGSVSRLTVISRHKTESVGGKIYLEGGKALRQERVGVPVGSVVRVEDLFYNVPARLKFLKSDMTEKNLINQIVSRYALAYPRVGFKLTQDNHEVIRASGNGNSREVLAQMYGTELARQMLEVDLNDEDIQVHGFISPVGQTRSNRKEIAFFVNGRWVQDTSLSSALIQAYHTLLMVGRYPIAALMIRLPFDAVDVNVHPAKAEIRFRDANRVFRAIQRAVKRALLAYSPAPQIPNTFWKPMATPLTIDPAWDMAQEVNKQKEQLPADRIESEVQNGTQFDLLVEKMPLLRVIGQVGAAYLVAEGPDGLYLIDQHAAHERVLFERFTRQIDKPENSQALLEAVVFQLASADATLLIQQLDHLNRWGFEVEPFGGNTFRVRRIPAILSGVDPVSAVRALVEDFEEDESPLQAEVEARLIARICKRAAVKAGQILSSDEQRALVRDLEKCQSPRTCPHGRPTMIHLSVDLLERQFGRRGSR
jgi:DNA mismatch repair protein MutL